MTSIESEIQRIGDISIWKRTHKKSYEVWMCRPKLGTVVYNKLEGTQYITDINKQFVISGTLGEQWIIDFNKLVSTYTFLNKVTITQTALESKLNKQGEIDWVKIKTIPNNTINWATLIDASIINFPVQTAYGDELLANRVGVEHGIGDMLVCSDDGHKRPNLNDIWVVNGEVFPRTYDTHCFTDIFPRLRLTNTMAKKPTSIINK